VDGSPPRSICGSGLIGLMAALHRAGHLDGRARLREGWNRIRRRDGGLEVIVVPGRETATGEDLVVRERELDNLLRSKAGMFALVQTLLSQLGLRMEDVRRFFVAGSFGVHIDPANAISIGMLPPYPLDRFHPLGNAALEGVIDLLRDPEAAGRLARIAASMTYIEINTDPVFMREFTAALFIPHTDPERFAERGGR